MVTPGVVPLSISRLNASDIRRSRTGESPSDSGLASGKGGGRGAAGCLAAVCAVMVSLPLALVVGRTDIIGVSSSLAQNARVEQGGRRGASAASALQSGRSPCLKRQISDDAWFR